MKNIKKMDSAEEWHTNRQTERKVQADQRMKEQGQVGQKGATCGSSNECVTQQTKQPTNRRTQPLIEVYCRT